MYRDIRPSMIVIALLGVGCGRAEPQVARTERTLTAASAEELPRSADADEPAEAERPATPTEVETDVETADASRDSTNAEPAAAPDIELVVDSIEIPDHYPRMRSRPSWVDERERVRRSGSR